MVRRILIFAVLAPSLWAATAPQRRPHVKRAAKQAAAVVPAQVAPPVPAQPAPPPTPEQQPPSLPQVAYRNGQLTIVARNSTLRDILMTVGQLAGARVDLPPGVGSQRIFTQLGPGPARDVVASLLNGSPDDYIILGSETTPGGIASIMVTPRQGGAVTASAPAQAQPMPQQNVVLPPQTPTDEDQNAEPEPLPSNEVQPEQPDEPMPATGPPLGSPQAQTDANSGQQQNQVKTPEQLLQELQRMQQRQQQQQQNNRVPHDE